MNENIKTYGNASRDYTSVSVWEADTKVDLTSNDENEASNILQLVVDD